MRRGNNKNCGGGGKIIKMRPRREYNKIMEKEGNKNEKGGAKKRWLAFFDYFKIILI